MGGDPYPVAQPGLDFGRLRRADQLDGGAGLAAERGPLGQQGFLRLREGEGQPVAHRHPHVMAEPLGRRRPHAVPFQRIGNKGDPRHLHGQRAGIDAGRLAAEGAALDQSDIHAAARREKRDRRSMDTAADDTEIVNARHRGAGSGMGMSP